MVKKFVLGAVCLFALGGCSGSSGLSGKDDLVVGSVNVDGSPDTIHYVLGNVDHPTEKIECDTLSVSLPGDWVVVDCIKIHGERLLSEYPREKVASINYIFRSQAKPSRS